MDDYYQKVQQDFTQRIRHGNSLPLPDNVSESRMKVYQELLFNNIYEIMNQCFPVITEIVDDKFWRSLVAEFIALSQSQTPYFHRLAQEMVSFLEKIKLPDYPYLAQLAHYEWIELELDIDDKKLDLSGVGQEIELSSQLIFSPQVRLLHYDFDVENIGVNYLPTKPVASYLLVYRNEDGHVDFMKLNQLSHLLLTLLMSEKSLEAVINEVIDSDPVQDKQLVISGAISLVDELVELGIIVGSS